jgi:hypothetical protein
VQTIKDSVFTEVALRKQAIDPERLRQARETQKELQSFGISKFIGAVIVEKGLATREVVRAVVEEGDGLWIRCQACKEPTAVAGADRNGRLQCPSCGQAIEYACERIPEEDLALSLAPPGERKRKRKAHPHDPARRPERTASPEGSRDPVHGGQKEKRPGAAGSVPGPKPQAAPRESPPGASPEAPDHPPVSEVKKFKVKGIIAASPAGRLFRVDGSGEIGALKLLDGALLAHKVQLKKWIGYMQAVQDLPRSASLKPIEFHREGEAAYVARPYLGEAQTLRSAIGAKSAEVCGAEAALKITEKILESLSPFHATDLAHGNLKPENVILTDAGPCLTDAGILHLFKGLPTEERALRLWESCRYHAPEVLQGDDPTPASDIYSLGRMAEEILEALDDEERRSDAAARLRKLAERMAAADPVSRYASAKEVLWDFRARAPAMKPRAGAEAAERMLERTSRRSRQRRLAGPVLLGAVLVGLAYQAQAWHSAQKAMASPHRAEEVSSRLIEARLRDLAGSTISGALGAVEAAERWREIAETLRGTPWEGTVEEASRRPLEHLSRQRQKVLSEAVSKALSLAEKREWAPALSCLLALGADVDSSSEAKAALQRVCDGLYQDEGMVLVPGGETPASGGGTASVGAFLIDAGLLTQGAREAHRARRPAAGGGDGDGQAAAGISFDEAKEIAASLGKRLPSAREWDRMASIAAAPRGIEEISAKRLRDLGTRFEWVADEGADDLSGAGYGWCRGGSRPGTPATHPARRRKSSGHPDVGARFARDL